MLTVQGTVPANTFGTHAATVVFVLPADRCTWTQTANATGGYDITNVYFQRGSAAQVAVSNAELGVIGKSGRFVKITA